MKWDPTKYAHYSNERSRPFFDLTGQINADAPTNVVDLGCGPGELTATLTERWPAATVRGLDSSPEMISRAQAHTSVEFALAAAEDFSAVGVDVLVSNALLQWVPTHRALLDRWSGELNSGGWLAFQVPSNFGAPSHRLMRELAESDRWNAQLGSVLRHVDTVSEPAAYLDQLTAHGLEVTAWQTNYLHVLQGEDPVLQWVRGTGLRPILDLLDDADTAEFEAQYAAMLRTAYPQHSYGTVFPFLRNFVVAHKPA